MAKYFTLVEAIYSSTATAEGIDNTPNDLYRLNLEELLYELDDIREAWGKPILISSGFRSKELNERLKGSLTSAHLMGNAVDIVPANGDLISFREFLTKYVTDNKIKFDQIIWEFKNNKLGWVHFGLYRNNGDQRQQIFELYT